MPISIETQTERRAKILARTREMIEQVGIEQLKVRDLAKHCDVTVPTLYNQFGNKEDLIFAAAEEVFRAHYEEFSKKFDKTGLEAIFHIDEVTADVILENSAIARRFATKVTPEWASFNVVQQAFESAIVELQRRRQIETWIGPALLAQRLYSRQRSVVLDWANGRTSDSHLRAMRKLEICLLLLSVARGATKKQLSELAQAQALILGHVS